MFLLHWPWTRVQVVVLKKSAVLLLCFNCMRLFYHGIVLLPSLCHLQTQKDINESSSFQAEAE
jgi:hypothetical protein